MEKVRTHYDNLKVARDAPDYVIRAAYKTLSQKYHPDVNPNDSDAHRVMSIINYSYEVLSDPIKRKEHDLWIISKERGNDKNSWNANPHTEVKKEESKIPRKPGVVKRLILHVLRNWAIYLILGLIGWVVIEDATSPPKPGPKPYQSTPPPQKQSYVRPLAAPSGHPWPNTPGYVGGFDKLNNNGLSSVTVDNTRNDSDVFVKLVSLDGVKAYPVRAFFISAHSQFTLKNVTKGSYDIRYRDLTDGYLARSESFDLEEIETYDGVRFSDLTMTLYKVQNGNMQTYRLSESEF